MTARWVPSGNNLMWATWVGDAQVIYVIAHEAATADTHKFWVHKKVSGASEEPVFSTTTLTARGTSRLVSRSKSQAMSTSPCLRGTHTSPALSCWLSASDGGTVPRLPGSRDRMALMGSIVMVAPKCDCKFHTPCPCASCNLCFFDPRHGTANGYGNLRCRCEPCRAAHAEDMYERKQQRIADHRMPEHLHGTAGGYGNWGCRCTPCTLAWNEETGERAKRMRRGLTDCARGVCPKPKRRRETLISKED
jgi:hypothetical protein